MLQTLDTSRTIEEEKANEFSEIVRSEVRAADGFAEADEAGKDALFLAVAQKFMEEDGGFMEADSGDAGPDAGTAGEMVPAFYKGKIGNSNVLIFGYMPVDGYGQLTLFTARYQDDESVTTLSQSEFKSRVDQTWRFFRQCYETPEQFSDNPAVSELARHIDEQACIGALKAVRIVFATNLRLTSRDYDRQAEAGGLEFSYDIYDIDRLYRTSDQSISADDIDVDFESWPCGALPCLEATGKDYQYKSYLLMISGDTLAALFRRYGSRLYDTNLRSYLESKTKVNKGMLMTIRSAPQKFLAYNNGLTAIASRIEVALRNGQPSVTRVVGLQIVNGAQTTSTIYKASTDKKSAPDVSQVHVVMKLTKTTPEDIETFVPEITEYANTQNPIKASDLQANKLIHRQMEAAARDTVCPGDIPRQWFYERTRGAYQAALAREGTTKKRRLEFQERIPSSNRFDKTDLAIFHMAWSGRPDSVSRGPQKNFQEFTKLFSTSEGLFAEGLIDAKFFKLTIARAIIYNAARKAVAKCGIPKIPSSVTAYMVAYFAHRFGKDVRLGQVWESQAVSEGLMALFERWAPEVNDVIIKSNAQDKLLPEWCKKDGCWTAVREHSFNADGLDIPEVGTSGPARAAPVPTAPARPAPVVPPVRPPLVTSPAPVAPPTSPVRPTLVAKPGAPRDQKRPVPAQAEANGDDIRLTMKVSPADWAKIAGWVATEPGFGSFHQKFAYSMAVNATDGWPREPSEKQAKIAARLARGALRASVIAPF
jgi:hypothetical protein